MLMKTGILYTLRPVFTALVYTTCGPFCKDATHMINVGLNYGKPMKCPKCKEDKDLTTEHLLTCQLPRKHW